MKIEASIAVSDQQSMMNPQDIRKREGDIISIVEAGRPKGFKTIDEYLTVPIETEATQSLTEIQQVLKMPYYKGGKIPSIDFTGEEPPIVAKNRHQIPLSKLGDIDLEKTKDIRCIYQPFLRESAIVAWPYWNREFLVMRYKGGVYEVRRTHKRQRKIYEEIIKGKVIRFIRPKEPALIIKVTEEESPWRPIYCNTATIGNDDEKVFEWSDTKTLIKDKYTNDWLGVKAYGIK